LFYIYSQSDQPIKVDFEWNPNKEQEGTIASVDKPGIKNMRDSCVQGKFYKS